MARDARGDARGDDDAEDRIRFDKWLWAARFFKTRSLAREAIEGGKVHCDGQRVKPGREMKPGMQLTIRQGLDEREVIVLGLSAQRGPASVAQGLYQETEASIARRERLAQARKAGAVAISDHRPDKKERRQIRSFRERQGEE